MNMIRELVEEYMNENRALKEQINILLHLLGDTIDNHPRTDWELDELVNIPQATVEIKNGVVHVHS